MLGFLTNLNSPFALRDVILQRNICFCECSMPPESIQWQGTQRRACGPGANWNVQVYAFHFLAYKTLRSILGAR